jgi:hypothetical protein
MWYWNGSFGLWDVMPCSLLDVYWCFSETAASSHPVDRGSRFLWNAATHLEGSSLLRILLQLHSVVWIFWYYCLKYIIWVTRMAQFLIRPVMVQGWDVFISLYITILINIYSLTSKILKERIMMFSFLLLSHSLSFWKSLPWIIRTTFQSSVSFVRAFEQSVDKNSHTEKQWMKSK